MFDTEQEGLQSVWWEETEEGPAVGLLDQTLLPSQTKYLRLTHEEEVAEAIRALRVRGAISLAVAAAFGLILGLARRLHEQKDDLSLSEARQHLQLVGDQLARTRPTAVNLIWAINRLLKCADEKIAQLQSSAELVQVLLTGARNMVSEDRSACLSMGRAGAELIADGATVLTHCNTGMLATMGIGTALAPIYVAHRSGKHILLYGCAEKNTWNRKNRDAMAS